MNENPFYYGRVVAPEDFCNRSVQMDELERACRNSNSVFLYSERRLGKTSLILNVLNRLPKTEYLPIYIDLWPTYGEDSFSLVMAKAVADAATNKADKLLEISKAFFGRLNPTVGIDESGMPTVTFGVGNRRIDAPALEEVLESPTRLGYKLEKKCVVVFDEFQQILQYEKDVVERKLRSVIQQHKNVAYMFLGSRKHLIHGLFSDSSRPLYRAATHFPLEPIDEEHWIPFIVHRFNSANKFITRELVQNICRQTDGHPFYTQHLCHLVWELTQTNEKVAELTIKRAIDLLLDRESYAFTILFDGLTPNQKRLLEAIAKEDAQTQLYESEFVQRAGFKSPSAVQSALKVLTDKDIVDRTEDGAYIVLDRFLKLWIKRRIHAV